jgi:hypothetical protein
LHALLRTVTLVATLVAVPGLAWSAVVGHIDTFQSLTSDGWFAGGLGLGQVPPVPPQVVTTGGPNGAGDAFLRVSAIGGNGPGSRLVAINGTQWAGNYLGAAIGIIALDLVNLGTSDLTVRLLFENPVGGPPTDEAVTNFGALLPAGGGWTHWLFPVSSTDLTPVFGSVDALLSNVTLMRVIHSVAADDADPITGVLGVDNISAAASVPEPGSSVLMGAGLLGLVRYVRRRHGKGPAY